MKKNMGSLDQLLRVLIAITVGILYYNNIISGTLGIVLGAISLVFLLTSLFGVCPLYSVLGINSCKVSKG